MKKLNSLFFVFALLLSFGGVALADTTTYTTLTTAQEDYLNNVGAPSSIAAANQVQLGTVVKDLIDNAGTQNRIAATTTTLTASQCGSTIYGDSADVITLPEASTVLGCRYTFIATTADDVDINPNDGTDQISTVASITGTNTTTVLAPSAGDAIRMTDIGASITLEAVGNNLWASVGVGTGIWTDVN